MAGTRKGLTLADNPALELQRLMREEQQPGEQADITSNTVRRMADTPTDRQTNVPSDTPTDTPADLPPPDPDAVARQKVRELSATGMKTITLKMPEAFNAYLDRYVHENWEKKLRKQDLLRRAMQLLVYELETGEQILDLDK